MVVRALAGWPRSAGRRVRGQVLHEGSRGTTVRDWQATISKLADAGKPSQPKVATDGIFGPKTKAVTQAFQRWAHITADGIVGVQTYIAAAKPLG